MKKAVSVSVVLMLRPFVLKGVEKYQVMSPEFPQ
jgi:hypothetical protein